MNWFLLAALTHLSPVRGEVIEPPVSIAWPLLAYGRVVTRRDIHVGVRPHAYFDGDETAGAVTLQVRF